MRLGSVRAPYDAVVTASFTYKTSKGLKVTASLLAQLARPSDVRHLGIRMSH